MADDQLLVIVDADTLAGWRRPTSSLSQLHDAVDALRRQAPEAVVAVIADASLKWALSDEERELIEIDIVNGDLLFAPAGCIGGHVGFIGRVIAKAHDSGYSAVAVTDQAIPDCPLAKVRRGKDGEWMFDLEGKGQASQDAVSNHQQRGLRRRRRATSPET